ncbi:MAG: LysR family transcriptional regulator [Proteobacteria bacterium]|nr:LysR family transcriptional regulator [Pseudomonadota bacterium]
MDRLEAMRLFVRVAERGSFSAVAQQSGLARSVVTRQIAALESHLRVKLLARSTRRLTLTSAGTTYLEKCRVILNLVDAAESGLDEERQVPRGPIRMSLPLSFGLRHLSSLLLEFATRYPEVSLDMDYSDRRSNLFEEGIDLAIRITGHLESNDVARRLSFSRMLAVASPEYLARHGEPRHPSELIHHECLGYTAAANPHSWEFLVDLRPHSFPVRTRLQANNGDILVQAAIAGFGLTCTPSFLCAEALAAGQVRQILADFPLAELGIYAVLPSNRHVPNRVRMLMDFLVERLGPEPPWERQWGSRQA